MEQKKEKLVAYCLAIILFAVGVACYAAFPQKAPEDPVRIMLKATAGQVLFNHKGHVSEDGYGIDCVDCHHEYDEDEGEKPVACGECHDPVDEEDSPKRSDAFHDQCIGCHEDDGTAPVDCSACHVM